MRVARAIALTDDERVTLLNWSRGRGTPRRLIRRARIVLAAADGRENKDIATALGCARRTVGRWRDRFAADRLAGIGQDAPRGGRPATRRETFEAVILRKTTQETPRNAAHWSTRSPARALGCSETLVRRV